MALSSVIPAKFPRSYLSKHRLQLQPRDRVVPLTATQELELLSLLHYIPGRPLKYACPKNLASLGSLNA